MKKLMMIGAVLLAGGLATALFQQGDLAPIIKESDATSAPSPKAVEATKKALEAEKQVKGVFYDASQVAQWQIGMTNDGSSRVGYALYVCQILKEKGAFRPETRVKIIDIANVLVPVKDRNLHGMGTVACEDHSVISSGDMRPVIVSALPDR